MGRLGYSIDEVNARLKSRGSKARLAIRGKSALYLQATLPAKPLSKRSDKHQQYIPLKLTYPAGESVAGRKARDIVMKKAESEADRLNGDIVYNRFDWENYFVKGTVTGTPIADLLAQFEKHYRDRNSLEDRTWINNYMRYYNYLPQDEPLTGKALLDSVSINSKAGTRTRHTFCQRYKMLAKFASVEVDFSEFASKERTKDEYELRSIPSDAEILKYRPQVEGRYKASLRGWQWVYSIIFVAGLRPHEAFFCEWSDEGLEVLKGKTGPRTVLYEIMELMTPGLVDEWSLKNISLPNIDAARHYESGCLGKHIATGLWKKNIPIKAYDIRHAFALRGISYNVPTATMAAMMGHDEDLHIRTYRKHLDSGRNKDILQKMILHQG